MKYKQLMIIRTNTFYNGMEEHFPKPKNCYIIFDIDEKLQHTEIEWLKPKECDIEKFNELLKAQIPKREVQK